MRGVGCASAIIFKVPVDDSGGGRMPHETIGTHSASNVETTSQVGAATRTASPSARMTMTSLVARLGKQATAFVGAVQLLRRDPAGEVIAVGHVGDVGARAILVLQVRHAADAVISHR